MKVKMWIGIIAVVAMVAMPALAGEAGCDASKAQTASNAKEGHDCDHDTQYCLNAMASKLKNKGWVGVELEEVKAGYEITRVEPDSPAVASGLREGDVLLALNGVDLNSENKESLHAIKSKMAPGKTVTYTISRRGKEKQVDVTLAPLPEAIMAKWIGGHMLNHASVEIAQN